MNYIIAFVVGGALCLPAQILLDKTKLTNARILTGYVVGGVLLAGIGLYEPLLNFASAGASVPLTGFGSILVKGVKTAIDEKGIMGILTGGLTGAAAGITAAMVLSLIWSCIFKSRQK